ncbi:phosphate ABC transporter substrate-binding protein PstS [Fertoebacter nigrum]|uniref:Phosphate-binding protein PstS n=1 Tax=Fertoeibacter niger TaxID=2656921 RepID=A0A8X8KRV2_9RHOB|nr:phosphate ABC transporter substrate-binding protein PstS [Fertoeibacter niger]NUB45682.1 phosphate ABC transporter substrate-binding protein PstS [Fertoeibacter niger]
MSGLIWKQAAAGFAVCAALLMPAKTAEADPILGAGSTFAFPMIASWSEGLQIDRAGGTDYVPNDAGVDYEPVGSVGGMMRLAQPQVDFAATDAPLPPAELEARNLAQFPIVVGGLAVVVNLPGVESGQMQMPRAVLADMYLGRITRWSDAALAAANPGLTLPDLPVNVVARLDGSGSTMTFTQYLARSSADWAAAHGADTRIDWPAGISVKGSGKIVQAVQTTPGAIGYVEYGQATRAGLTTVAVENAAGAFIAPSPEAFAQTARQASWAEEQGFYLHLTGIDAADAYPITTATFALMRKGDTASRTLRTLYFFNYALERGADRARGLGYVPLPKTLVAQVQNSWRKTLPGAEGF